MRITPREIIVLALVLALAFFSSLVNDALKQEFPIFAKYPFIIGGIGLLAILFLLKRFPLLKIG